MAESEILGTLLIKQGKLTHEQLTEVLEYQCRLPSSQMMSLEEILISFEYASEADIQALRPELSAPNTYTNVENTFAAPAVSNDMETMLTLNPPKKLGQIMLEERLLEEWQLTHALLAQKEPTNQGKRLGSLLLELGYVAQDKLSRALSIQLSGAAAPYFEPLPPNVPKLGERLVNAGIIQEWQLLHALTLQRENTDKKTGLGTLLVRLGYAPQDVVAKALGEQAQDKQDDRAIGK
ncbi:MAG: hypothetical protein IV090_01990 [Candidatus Sericytochromatia bacterium]|nr:hypothetical protein [Candidatus Sericytochromatia bacterium]